MNYAQFKAEWNTRRVDYDHVYGYQCVDLILEFLKECAGVASGVWGNAIDYANHPTAAFLGAVNKVSANSLQQGDIVVLIGLNGNPYGHIGLYDNGSGSSIALLEQNGATGGGIGTGKDAISVWRTIPTSRIVAVYRLKAFTNPTPAPLPNGNATTATIPSNRGPFHFYYINSSYNPNDRAAVKGILRPDVLGPLTYKVEAYVSGGKGIVITTQDFGRGVIWIDGTGVTIS